MDFLDNVLLDHDVVMSASNWHTDTHLQDSAVTDSHQSDHMYSRSHSDSASEGQTSFRPPSVGSHTSLYSYRTDSPPSGLESSSATSPSEFCTSPLSGNAEDLTVDGVLTVVEPTVVMLSSDNIVHVVTDCDEAVTDDSGVISVGT